MKVIWSSFAILHCVLGLTQGVQTMTFGWLMKYFKKQKWRRTKSNLKRYELQKNIYVGKCKSSRKKKRKDFNGRIKNISAKNNTTLTNSTPALSRTNSLNNTTQIIPRSYH